jgi:hypothetical protein
MKAKDFIDALQKHVQEIANDNHFDDMTDAGRRDVAKQIDKMIHNWKVYSGEEE